jgi:hypothetical protein
MIKKRKQLSMVHTEHGNLAHAGFEVLAAVISSIYLLGYDAVSSGRSSSTFQRNLLPLSTASKSKPSK